MYNIRQIFVWKVLLLFTDVFEAWQMVFNLCHMVFYIWKPLLIFKRCNWCFTRRFLCTASGKFICLKYVIDVKQRQTFLMYYMSFFMSNRWIWCLKNVISVWLLFLTCDRLLYLLTDIFAFSRLDDKRF